MTPRTARRTVLVIAFIAVFAAGVGLHLFWSRGSRVTAPAAAPAGPADALQSAFVGVAQRVRQPAPKGRRLRLVPEVDHEAGEGVLRPTAPAQIESKRHGCRGNDQRVRDLGELEPDPALALGDRREARSQGERRAGDRRRRSSAP